MSLSFRELTVGDAPAAAAIEAVEEPKLLG